MQPAEMNIRWTPRFRNQGLMANAIAVARLLRMTVMTTNPSDTSYAGLVCKYMQVNEKSYLAI